jgi:type IV secretory pathway TrbF-like protein
MKGKSLKEISDFVAAELCRRVNCPYPSENGRKIKVSDYGWTQAEEDDYCKWLEDYLKTVQPFKRMNKKRRQKEIDWIIFQYSWKIKESNNEGK